MPEGVPVEYPIETVWEGGFRWRCGAPGGPTMLVDGNKEVAPSPVDALIISLASCSGSDVVDYLEKRRTPPAAVKVSVNFSRASTFPRRLTQAHLTYTVASDAGREHVERAVELSFEKYCSVASSLAPDTEISWEVVLEPAGQTAGA
ncbi:MAG TPA: OsmC family protein [Longimicrobium sp.]|nr:OsmC family protein [Longimicrobium sp.]